MIGYLILSQIEKFFIVEKKFCTKKGLLSLSCSSCFVLVIMCVGAPLGMHLLPLLPTFDQDIEVQNIFWMILWPKMVHPCFNLKTYCILNNNKYIAHKAELDEENESIFSLKIMTAKYYKLLFKVIHFILFSLMI